MSRKRSLSYWFQNHMLVHSRNTAHLQMFYKALTAITLNCFWLLFTHLRNLSVGGLRCNKKQLCTRMGSGGKHRREKPRLPHQLPWIKRFIKEYIETGTEEPGMLRWRPPNASFLIGGWMVGQLCYVWSRPSWTGLALGHRMESQILWLKDLSVQSRFWKPETDSRQRLGQVSEDFIPELCASEPLSFAFSVCREHPTFPCPKQPTVRQRVQFHVGACWTPRECRGHIKNLLTLKSQLCPLIPSLNKTKSRRETLLRAGGGEGTERLPPVFWPPGMGPQKLYPG